MSQSRHPDARIKELAAKKAQLDAQIAALDSRRRLSQKKDEDRIKWLLGTLVFDRLSAEPALQSIVRRDLPDRLTQRDRDRGLWQILFPDAQEDQRADRRRAEGQAAGALPVRLVRQGQHNARGARAREGGQALNRTAARRRAD